MKIVWICHFSTSDIRSILGIRSSVHNFAPWIANTIPIFEDSSEHELHIISPHRYLRKTTHFDLRGVHYHFYNPGIPFWGRHWPSFFRWDLRTGFRRINRDISKLVSHISPDIVHLQGAENPYYSSSVLQLIDKYPILVNLQRMNLTFGFGASQEAKIREEVEREILSRFGSFSVRTKTMEQDLKSYNPSASTYWVNYLIPMLTPISCDKIYDLVFFARVSPTKGIEELLQASVTLAEQLGGLKLLVIGAVEDSYKDYLTQRYHSDKLTVEWKGVLATLEEVHAEASKAKISVLPTHQDIIPGTIVESMMLGLPVVSTSVGSIPELNSKRDSVWLVDKGDVKSLTHKIGILLNDQNEARALAERARQTISEWVGGKDVLSQHITAYLGTIESFNNKKRIG